LFGSNTFSPEKQSVLQKLRDFLFAGAAFPTGMVRTISVRLRNQSLVIFSLFLFHSGVYIILIENSFIQKN
jgi:hypothetical protein